MSLVSFVTVAAAVKLPCGGGIQVGVSAYSQYLYDTSTLFNGTSTWLGLGMRSEMVGVRGQGSVLCNMPLW